MVSGRSGAHSAIDGAPGFRAEPPTPQGRLRAERVVETAFCLEASCPLQVRAHDVVRTPEERFAAITDYPWPVQYAEVGSPGGAAKVGPIPGDHPVVAALPPNPND